MARLPPFFALRALEAAARHRSYSGAAGELAVTHGAVSHQIRRLEAELGARLFQRSGNRMLPSPEAERLAAEVRRSLEVLHAGVAAFASAGQRDPLVVSLNPQFAARWLPPRLPALLDHPAGANLQLRVDDRLADFATDGVDMGVRYGLGGWSGLQAVRLFEEVLFPVCAPEVAERHPMKTPEDLVRAPLLHHSDLSWSLWFDGHDIAPPPQVGMVFDDSLMLYAAAAQGLGVALARRGLVEEDLQAGRLVRPLPGQVTTELGFFVVWRADNRKLTRIHALRDWLVANANRNDPHESEEAA